MSNQLIDTLVFITVFAPIGLLMWGAVVWCALWMWQQIRKELFK